MLRDEWGFDGCVVSDYFSIRQLADYHHLAVDAEDAAVLALEAGLDVELPGTDCYGDPLLRAVRAGRVAEATIDAAVARVLTAKFELGLFERPYVDPERAAVAVDTPAHRRLARTIARKSLVLLRNDGVLPLRGGRIAAYRAQRRPRPPPLRRLHLPGARRVAGGGAAQRAERVLDAAGRAPPARPRRRGRHDHRRRAGRPLRPGRRSTRRGCGVTDGPGPASRRRSSSRPRPTSP